MQSYYEQALIVCAEDKSAQLSLTSTNCVCLQRIRVQSYEQALIVCAEDTSAELLWTSTNCMCLQWGRVQSYRRHAPVVSLSAGVERTQLL